MQHLLFQEVQKARQSHQTSNATAVKSNKEGDVLTWNSLLSGAPLSRGNAFSMNILDALNWSKIQDHCAQEGKLLTAKTSQKACFFPSHPPAIFSPELNDTKSNDAC